MDIYRNWGDLSIYTRYFYVVCGLEKYNDFYLCCMELGFLLHEMCG